MNAISPKRLTPYEAYVAAETQKAELAQAFFEQIITLYHRTVAQRPTSATLGGIDKTNFEMANAFAKKVDKELKGRDFTSRSIRSAVRLAYREYARQFWIQPVFPDLLSGQSPAQRKEEYERRLSAFHQAYIGNFRIPAEQESKRGFRELLSAPARPDGYREVAYAINDGLAGKFIMGTNFSMQPTSNSIHFIYGFVQAEGRHAIGFSKPLLNTMLDVADVHMKGRPSKYSGKPLITFEKNKMADMTLGNILRDTAGININRPPHEGDDLTRSSIGQQMRDLVWDRMGAKIVDYNYIQSSLDGVVKIEDPNEEALAIRYLNKDASLSADERQRAQAIMTRALDGKEEGCTVLNLCVFAPPGVNAVRVAQIEDAMEIFQGNSVVKEPAGIRDDIYFKASMADLKAKAKDGMIPLTRIKAFGGRVPGVAGFSDAEQLTKILLRHVTWAELRANADRPYSEWLDAKLDQIAPEFAEYKATQAALSGSRAVAARSRVRRSGRAPTATA